MSTNKNVTSWSQKKNQNDEETRVCHVPLYRVVSMGEGMQNGNHRDRLEHLLEGFRETI